MKYGGTHEDGTECSETFTYKIQTPGNYPEERLQHSEYSESLKLRTTHFVYQVPINIAKTR
jgi:hypothetical protein